jgi:antitoxin (DNA-binding transcriptional repressor) of toxin-antitoxin stability system
VPYIIEYSPEAEEHLQRLTARQRKIVLDTVDRQLLNQPNVETKNRKPMRPNPVAPWELRIGTCACIMMLRSILNRRSWSERWGFELKKASEPLSKYAQKARKDPIIVVKKGKPFAAVVPIRNADEETVSLSTNRKFLAIIERSRSRTKKEGAISSKELRRRLGLKK